MVHRGFPVLTLRCSLITFTGHIAISPSIKRGMYCDVMYPRMLYGAWAIWGCSGTWNEISQSGLHQFSATWCLLLQHTAYLASNSSGMDSKIVQCIFPRRSRRIW